MERVEKGNWLERWEAEGVRKKKKRRKVDIGGGDWERVKRDRG